MKKESEATNYLTTYGYVILIVIIVAAVLAFYGIYGPEKFLSQIDNKNEGLVYCINTEEIDKQRSDCLEECRGLKGDDLPNYIDYCYSIGCSISCLKDSDCYLPCDGVDARCEKVTIYETLDRNGEEIPISNGTDVNVCRYYGSCR